jgi:hypothetical protein
MDVDHRGETATTIVAAAANIAAAATIIIGASEGAW